MLRLNRFSKIPIRKFFVKPTQLLSYSRFSSITNRYIDPDQFEEVGPVDMDYEEDANDIPISLEDFQREITRQSIINPNPVICNEIVQFLTEKCAENVHLIDITDKSFMANYMIICSVQSGKTLRNLALELKDAFSGRPIRTLCNVHEMLSPSPKICGLESPDWITVDFGTIIVHLMLGETRERYALEQIWNGSEDMGVFEVQEEDYYVPEEDENMSENVSL